MNWRNSVLIISCLVGSGCQTEASEISLQSNLPKLRPIVSDADCENELSFAGQNEISLPAWIATAESIFVGTVAGVGHVDSGPVLYHCWDDDGEFSTTTLPNTDACPLEDGIYRAIQIDFQNVETLYGEPLDDSISIQMGPIISSDYPGISFRKGDPYPIDASRNRVYRSGSRIGAALVTDAFGVKRWHYTQFEVVDSKIYLSEVNTTADPCRIPASEIGIPRHFDGVGLDEFEAAIRAEYTLTDLDLTAISIHQGRMNAHSSGTYTLSTCGCGDRPADWEDPTIPNDPEFSR